MLHVNAFIREQDGFFSLDNFKFSFLYEEMYIAASIGDFCREKNTVKETGWSPFNPRKQYYHNCTILFPSCYYGKTAEPDYVALHKEMKDFFAGIQEKCEKVTIDNMAQFSDIKKEMDDFTTNFRLRTINGELYDTGQYRVPIRAPDNVPENKALYKVEIEYRPKSDFCTLKYYQEYMNYQPFQKDSSRSTLIERIQNIIPQPA